MDTINRVVTLNNGYTMPVIGLGTWDLRGEVCSEVVYQALKIGYRLIDTAKLYANEVEVGQGLKRAIGEGIVKRADVFITSKIGPYGYKDYDKAILECLRNLDCDYIDLMMLHQSGEDDNQIYDAIERAVDKGIVRTLGISNYYTKAEFERITSGRRYMPAVIQNENHIFYQNTELMEYVKKYGCFLESYYPFGGRGRVSASIHHKLIQKIAQEHHKTAAQIILRWHLQAGYLVIPSSGNVTHIADNFTVFDFSLSEEEMTQIALINTKRRYENW